MLTAHANTTTEDFIAQLRTFVIAFGCNSMVVDCVDNLADVEELEDTHAKELQEVEDNTARETKQSITRAVQDWAYSTDISAELRSGLLTVIEEA